MRISHCCLHTWSSSPSDDDALAFGFWCPESFFPPVVGRGASSSDESAITLFAPLPALDHGRAQWSRFFVVRELEAFCRHVLEALCACTQHTPPDTDEADVSRTCKLGSSGLRVVHVRVLFAKPTCLGGMCGCEACNAVSCNASHSHIPPRYTCWPSTLVSLTI